MNLDHFDQTACTCSMPVPVEHKILLSPGKKTRRPRLGREDALRLSRSTSMSRIFPSPTKSPRRTKAAWGHESCTALNFEECSRTTSSSDDMELDASAFLQELGEAVQEQTKRKQTLEKYIESTYALAHARYAGGSRLGAILSMRRVYLHEQMKAYVAATRYRLVRLQQQVESEVQCGSNDIDSILVHRRQNLQDVLRKLRIALNDLSASHQRPSDQTLIDQLLSSSWTESRATGDSLKIHKFQNYWFKNRSFKIATLLILTAFHSAVWRCDKDGQRTRHG